MFLQENDKLSLRASIVETLAATGKPCEYVETMEGAYNYDANTPVQWSFGYGLSYSEVEYKDLKLVELAFKDAVGPLSIIFTLQAADQFEPAFR